MKVKLNISCKFFLMFFLFSALILASFSCFFYLFFSRILIEREFSSFKTLTSSFLAQTENEICNMDDISIDIFYINFVQENLNSLASLLDLFVALNGANIQVPFISIYSNEGDQVTMGRYSYSGKTDLSDLSWIEETQSRNCQKYISLPYQSNIMQNSLNHSPSYISLYRILKGDRGNHIGYIETAQFCTEIFQSIITYLKQKDHDLNVLVFNEEGSLVFPFDLPPSRNSTFDYYYQKSTEAEEAEVFLNSYTNKKELIFSQKSSYTNWTYICTQEMKTVLLPVQDFSRILLSVTVFLLLIVTIISYYMSNSVTRPIKDLLNQIHLTNLETLSQEKKYINSAYNEFDELNDAFNHMSTNLKKSMEELLIIGHKESESRFMALQSQINPHIYYNSLSSIIALTEAGKVEDVIKFCINLSRIMRYATQGQPKSVSIITEIEYAEKFLYCMKVRYQSSLDYQIHIDNRLAEINIPKLLLQPIIENALKYGTDCAPPWKISIESEITKESWKIKIYDSGNGFSEQSFSVLKKRIAEVDRDPASALSEIDGLGLINVYSRWKIFCGKDFIFSVENTSQGCCVSIGKKLIFEEKHGEKILHDNIRR